MFIGAEEVQSGLIARQARAAGIRATLIGAAPLGTDVFLNTAGADAAEGTLFSTPYPTNDENDATRTFAAAYQAAFGETPEFHAAKAYDGARIVIEALRTSNNATGLPLAQAIRSVRFHGLLGTFAFDSSGVGIQRTRVATIKAGKVIALTTQWVWRVVGRMPRRSRVVSGASQRRGGTTARVPISLGKPLTAPAPRRDSGDRGMTGNR